MSDAEDLERFRRLDDEQLIRLDAELDPRALEVLYERHHVVAFSLAGRIVGSRDQAQDVVHEAFLTLWHDAGRYDPTRGPVRTWLMSIVHDRGLDTLRRLSIRERLHPDAAVRAIAPTESDLTSATPDARETPAMRAALQALPEQERRIIELAYYDGWTQSEIADMLKLPLDTIRRSARAGLLRLRETLLSQLEAPP
ncbi:MAG TPA: sigma-70 family RNA polymerase sigma factor [Solirubrobacteraceae bacterium]